MSKSGVEETSVLWCFFNLFGVLIPIDELGASQSAEKMPPSATDSVQEAMNDVRLKMKKLF